MNAIIKGIELISKLFFLPILSAITPAANGPIAAARGRKEPTHPSCVAVKGLSRGLSSIPFSLGISGDVQPNAVPQKKEARFPITKTKNQ